MVALSSGDSVTVKLDGIDGSGDLPSPVAAPFLLGLLVPEGFALPHLQVPIGSLPPAAPGSSLLDRTKDQPPLG